ncbi:MAG: homoserine dehydrogenase [Thiohalomonadales bacterium]
MKPVNVGLLGLGTVGGGTVNVLQRNMQEISRRAGAEIIVTHAATRDPKKPRICDTSGIELSNNLRDVVDNPDIDIVVELIGGDTLALELVMRAINNGKHVVTANKALIAKFGNQIFSSAQSKGVMVAFEAAVAGGIPIIKSLREGLSGNKINWLAGIINGTGNYILSEMRDKGIPFEQVLADAQRLGYAEADPAFDVNGTDAAHKLTILASIAFGIPLQFDKVAIEGITEITGEDVANAEQLGYRIKHLGIARRTAKGIELRVHLTFIPERRLIANVDGVMNAVLVHGDAVGPTLYYGAGAGAEPTASAVVADIVDVARTLTSDPENRVPHLAFQPDALADLPILPLTEIETAYYLRIQAEDKPGVLADITQLLAEQGISIEAIIQKEPPPGETSVTVIMLTHNVQEGKMDRAIKNIEDLTAINGSIMRIRVERLS